MGSAKMYLIWGEMYVRRVSRGGDKRTRAVFIKEEGRHVCKEVTEAMKRRREGGGKCVYILQSLGA